MAESESKSRLLVNPLSAQKPLKDITENTTALNFPVFRPFLLLFSSFLAEFIANKMGFQVI